MELIRGTTPSIIFTFEDIQASDIAVAYLSIKQLKTVKIEKGLSDAALSDGRLVFSLSQADTLGLDPALSAKVILDWKTSAGVRGRSNIVEATVSNSGKDAVI